MSLIKLPYLGNSTYGNQSKSPKGYNEIKGLDQYKGAYTRNVRIVRVDLLSNLCDHFSEETIRKHRTVIYYILAGYATASNHKLVVESLEYIYTVDDVFRVKLGKLVYFRDTNLEGLSIYDALLKDVENSIPDVWKDVVKEVPHIKTICDSELYLYFSVSDSIPVKSLVQIKGLEVISR
jgi:hypothetical protein